MKCLIQEDNEHRIKLNSKLFCKGWGAISFSYFAPSWIDKLDLWEIYQDPLKNHGSSSHWKTIHCLVGNMWGGLKQKFRCIAWSGCMHLTELSFSKSVSFTEAWKQPLLNGIAWIENMFTLFSILWSPSKQPSGLDGNNHYPSGQ